MEDCGAKNFAFIDVGSNSVRLLVVQMRGGGFTILREEKETIRLGDRVFQDGFINQNAMNRGVDTIGKFLKIAKGLHVKEVVAVATSAVREARNQNEFLGHIKNDTGLDVRVVSGKEEARLIFLGVSSGVNLTSKHTLFIDIGGGSTELIIGNRLSHDVLKSLNLGAIRLSNIFLSETKGRFEDEIYENMCSYVRAELNKAGLGNFKLSGAIGSSGTIVNLAEMANCEKLNGDLFLKFKDLEKLSESLRAITIEERRHYPLMNAERADIIIGGAAILETVMKDLKIPEIRVSARGLNYGLLVDHMSRGVGDGSKRVTRERSIQDLAITYGANDAHSEKVARLSIELFYSLKNCGLIDFDDQEMEFLRYAAQLHDIGNAIAYRDHNLHGAYIIRNTELIGFDQFEIGIIASIVRYHMKRLPTRKDLLLNGISKGDQKRIKILSAILRIAENLDRSHLGHVKKVEISATEKGRTSLLLYADGDVDVEMWSISSVQECFKSVFGARLEVDVMPTQLYNSSSLN